MVECGSGLAPKEIAQGLMGLRRHEGGGACQFNPRHSAQRFREVRLQCRHGDPTILAGVNAVTGVASAYRGARLGQTPGTGQGEVGGCI